MFGVSLYKKGPKRKKNTTCVFFCTNSNPCELPVEYLILLFWREYCPVSCNFMDNDHSLCLTLYLKYSPFDMIFFRHIYVNGLF